MSASLVGSEMCIRDSYPPPPVLPSCQEAPPTHSPVASFSAPCCTADSVSYTHLTLPTICSV
eukprot:1028728-Alexandrium_andersonii.AAC.1